MEVGLPRQVQRVFAATHGPLAHNIAATRAEAVAGGWARDQEGFDDFAPAADNATALLTTREHLEDNDEVAAQVVAAEEGHNSASSVGSTVAAERGEAASAAAASSASSARWRRRTSTPKPCT